MSHSIFQGRPVVRYSVFSGVPVRYAKDKANENGEHWVTLGAKGSEGAKSGGFPALIDGEGNIVASRVGGLQGKNVKDVKGHFDEERGGKGKKEAGTKGDASAHKAASAALHNEVSEYAKLGIDPEMANAGDCSTVAREAVKTIREAGGEAAFGSTKGGLKHIWVVAGGKHYDIESPGGVDDPKDLPFFQRNPEMLEGGWVQSDGNPVAGGAKGSESGSEGKGSESEGKKGLADIASPGQKVRIAGAEFTYVGKNPDGTHKVRNSEGGEFDTDPGEEVTPLGGSSSAKSKEPLPSKEQFVRQGLQELSSARQDSLRDAEAKAASFVKNKGISLPVGISPVQAFLAMDNRQLGEEGRKLAAAYRVAKANTEADTTSDRLHLERTHKALAERTSTPFTSAGAGGGKAPAPNPRGTGAATPERAFSLQNRYGLSSHEAAALNHAIEEAKGDTRFANPVEALQKHALKIGVASNADMSKLGDMKFLKQVLADYPDLSAKPGGTTGKLNPSSLQSGAKIDTESLPASKGGSGPFAYDDPESERQVVTLPNQPSRAEIESLKAAGFVQEWKGGDRKWLGPKVAKQGGGGAGEAAGKPKEQNFTQFLAERGIEDPGLEHGLHGPGGKISKRALEAFHKGQEPKWIAHSAAMREYQRLVNEGKVVDPLGKFKPMEKSDESAKKAERLRGEARRFRDMAASGMKPKAFVKQAEKLEAEADVLAPPDEPAKSQRPGTPARYSLFAGTAPVRYAKDASGHEHDEKGLFTGDGGGQSDTASARASTSTSNSQEPPQGDPVHSYLEGFLDPGDSPATAEDANSANADLEGEDSEWRIVPDGNGSWKATRAEDLEDELGDDWTVAVNPLTERPEAASPEWFDQAREWLGDEDSSGYVTAFNDPNGEPATEEDAKTANEELRQSGSKYRLRKDEASGYWIAAKTKKKDRNPDKNAEQTRPVRYAAPLFSGQSPQRYAAAPTADLASTAATVARQYNVSAADALAALLLVQAGKAGNVSQALLVGRRQGSGMFEGV